MESWNSLKVSTPDPTKYHPGNSYGTTIPRSAAEGQSLGFDPNVPGTVIVDPGMTDGGFTVDMSKLGRDQRAFNEAASREGVIGDVSSFYKNAQESIQSRAHVVEVQPLVPAFDADFQRLGVPVSVQPPLGAILGSFNMGQWQAGVPAADAPPSLYGRGEATSPPTHYDTGTLEQPPPGNTTQWDDLVSGASLGRQTAQQTTLLNSLVERVNQQNMLLNSMVGPMGQRSKVEPSKGEPTVDVGFASLQIPFLTGAKPERPQYETYFEMSKLGTMSARYHAVVPGRDCLALIYDTRFEDGFQYLPPNLGEESITVSVPKLKKVYQCSSLGLHWTLGCLDVVMLLMHKEEAQ